MKKDKKITIEDLARMVQKGFSETGGEINGVKEDVAEVKNEMRRSFKAVDERFDKIEKLILADHKRRIERLEDEMKDLKNLLAVK